MGFEQQIDQWHEYYLAVAGAAAVLLGLVFIARRPFGLYLLAAGSAALIASATRSTWDLLVLGRTQGLE